MQSIATDATNFREKIEVYAADGSPATGLTHASAIAFAYRRPADADWVAVSVVAGSATHTDGGFRPQGGHIYEFCWPDAVVVANESTLLRYVYDGKTHYDVVSARLVSESSRVITVAQSDVATASLPSDTSEITRGSDFTETIEGITDISDATAIYYSLKLGDVADSAAILLVRKNLNAGTGSEGLLTLNGAAHGTAADASIAHTTYDVEGVTMNRFTVSVKGVAASEIDATLTVTPAGRAGFTREVETNGYDRGWKLVGDVQQHFSVGKMRVRSSVIRAIS